MFVTVNVEDVNDNSPEFTNMTYTLMIPENTATNTRYTDIKATDPDSGSFGQLEYSIITLPGGQHPGMSLYSRCQ